MHSPTFAYGRHTKAAHRTNTQDRRLYAAYLQCARGRPERPGRLFFLNYYLLLCTPLIMPASCFLVVFPFLFSVFVSRLSASASRVSHVRFFRPYQSFVSRAAHRARYPASKHWTGPPPRCGASRRACALRRGRPHSPGTITSLHRLLRRLASSLLPAPCAAPLRPAPAVPLRSLRVAQCAQLTFALKDQNKPVRLTLIRRAFEHKRGEKSVRVTHGSRPIW